MLNIKKTRKSFGISQVKLAKKINISQVYLSYIENNHRKPSLNLLERIANALDVPISSLWDENPNKETI